MSWSENLEWGFFPTLSRGYERASGWRTTDILRRLAGGLGETVLLARRLNLLPLLSAEHGHRNSAPPLIGARSPTPKDGAWPIISAAATARGYIGILSTGQALITKALSLGAFRSAFTGGTDLG
jgi:hypothetical protein